MTLNKQWQLQRNWQMSNNVEPVQLTDILYFNRKENKRTKLKDCEIINDFLFSKNTFFLVRKGHLFIVCYSVKGELVSLWHHKDKEGDETFSASDVTSEFRKQYVRKGITQERLELFLKEPLEHEKKYKP